MPFVFNWNVDLGQAMTVLAVVASGIFAVTNVRSDVRSVGERLKRVEDEVSNLAGVVLSNARLEERYAALALRVTAMEAEAKSR